MPGTTHPRDMSAEEIRAEVALLLARGYMRLRRRQAGVASTLNAADMPTDAASENLAESDQIGLDVSGE